MNHIDTKEHRIHIAMRLTIVDYVAMWFNQFKMRHYLSYHLSPNNDFFLAKRNVSGML